MKVLVTGFDPFGGDQVNPAFEAVKLLPAEIAGAEIVPLEIPTVFEECAQVLQSKMRDIKPDIVICVGQAGGRSAISLEQVAINLVEARIPDNKGNQPLGEKIEEKGEPAYFTSLPIKAMMQNIHANHLPAYISYTAGTFVCNDIMYRLLYMIEQEFHGVCGGFIHVPFEPSQVIDRAVGTPSMTIQAISDSLKYGIEAAVTVETDIKINAGTTH